MSLSRRNQSSKTQLPQS